MKQFTLFVFLSFLFSSHIDGQILFERGYIIHNTGIKKQCLIRNSDWKNNPSQVKIKLDTAQKEETYTIQDIQEFAILPYTRYKRFTVNIDISNDFSFKEYSPQPEPKFKTKTLFLKQLVEGDASLYVFTEAGRNPRFFYEKDGNIAQLIYKEYKSPGNIVRANEQYKAQLQNKLYCSGISLQDIKDTKYRERALIDYFIKYNDCKNASYTIWQELKEPKAPFKLSLRPGVNYSTLSIKNSQSLKDGLDFAAKTTARIGLLLEYTLPYKNNTWTIFVEPNYIYFKSDFTSEGIYLGGTTDFKAIELPIGARRYFYPKGNPDNSLFISCAYALYQDLNKATIVLQRPNEFIDLEIGFAKNFNFGIGYEFKNKYSIELNYGLPKNLTADTYLFWKNPHQSIGLYLGYNFL